MAGAMTGLTARVTFDVPGWWRPGLPLLLLCLLFAGCGSDSTASPTPTFPNVAGTWSGDYQIAACNDQGVPGFCSGYPPVGSVAPITLTLTQNRDQLSGTLTLGEFVVPVTGTVTSSGRIALSGRSQALSATVQGIAFSVVLTVSNWDTQAAGATMTGGWRQTYDISGALAGQAITENTIRTLTRS